MWWGIGFGALIWIVLFVWLGIRTLRNGHGWMFFLGIFFPLLWVIGAFMQPARGRPTDLWRRFVEVDAGLPIPSRWIACPASTSWSEDFRARGGTFSGT